MLELGLEEYYISPEEREQLSIKCAAGELCTEVAHTYIVAMIRHFDGRVMLEQEELDEITLHYQVHQRVPRPSRKKFADELWLFDPNEQCVWPELIPALDPRPPLIPDFCPDKKVWALKGSFGYGVGALILGMMFELDDVHVDLFWFYAVKATKLCMMMELKINVIHTLQEHMDPETIGATISKEKIMTFYFQAVKRMEEISQIYKEYTVMRNRQVYYCNQVQYHQTRYELPSVMSSGSSLLPLRTSSNGDIGMLRREGYRISS